MKRLNVQRRRRNYDGLLLPLLLSLLLTPGQDLRAQSQDKDFPPPPTINRLELNTVTNKVTIHFTPATKQDHYLEPAETVIFRCDANGDNCVEIASLPITDRSYLDNADEANPSEGPISYRLASRSADNKTCDMTDRHTTMFLQLEYDKCKDKVTLNWTQYIGWSSFSKYVVYRSEHTPISDQNEITTVPKGSPANHVDENVARDRRFYYAVRMEREGANNTVEYVWSNTVDIETRKTKVPGRMIIDSVISRNESNSIRYEIDPAADVSYFELIRRDDTLQGKTQWVVIERFAENDHNTSIDDRDGNNTHGRPRYYHLRAVDECDQEVAKSAVLNSTVVRAANREKVNTIHWNPLSVQKGAEAEYRIKRIAREGGQLVEKEISVFKSGQQLEFKDDISDFNGKKFTSKFCYYVEAWEMKNGRRGRFSRSNTSCCFIQPKIILPNAIAPLERSATNRLTRNQFAPVDNEETSYKIVIYDRAGQIIFDKRDTPWIGTKKDGSYVPEGAYIYRVTVYTEGYPPRTVTGSLMVVYPTKN